MKNSICKPGNFSLPSCQSGLSLVELMISLTIGLVLLAGITTLISRQSSTRTEMEKSSRQIENGRYAIQILQDDIELAGFYGDYSPPISATYGVPADPCSTSTTPADQGWASATPTVPVAISGYPGTSTAPAVVPTCVTDRKAGTAILVLRRTATTTTEVAAAVAGTTYLQVSRCNSDTSPFILGTGSFTLKQKNCTTLAPLWPNIVRIYYISTCSICGTGGDTIPTLKMVEFVGGIQTIIPLVEGIEDMQFDYGVDSTNDGAPDSYTTTPATWADVMTVRVNLLARNIDPTPGYTDTKTYTLGGAAPITPGGAYKRHVYTQLIRAVNPSGRRE